MNETQANLFPAYAPPVELSKEEISRSKYFADLQNADMQFQFLIRHLDQFEGKSSEVDAALIKIKEAQAYVARLQEKYHKDEHARNKAHYDKMVEEGKARQKESEAAVKDFEEKMAKRVAKIIQQQAAQPKAEQPTPPEPN